MRSVCLFVFLLVLAGLVLAFEDRITFGSFASSGLTGWAAKSFQGETHYEIVEIDNRKVLQADSKASASGLFYEVEFDPKDYPVLSWRWKIDGIVEHGDSRTRDGDDYAARVYVIFPHWFFPKTRSLNYIWANRLPKGEFQPNAFTGNAVMCAVQSGPEKAGQWVREERNLLEDYRRAFGEEPRTVGAIAIMTDTDNTGGSARAWYADIEARRR